MDSSLCKSKFVRWAVCCLLVCCCLADAASGATKKKTTKKKSSSSTSASKSDKSSKSSSGTTSTNSGVLSVTGAIQGGSTIDINPNAINTQILGSAGGTLATSSGLFKTGTGTLTINGNSASTYTLLTAGTLNVNNLPTITTSAGLTRATFTLTGAAATTGSTAYNGDFTFSGSSNLSSGTGAVTLSGANTYTGATNINSGALVLNGGTLANTGSLNINSGTVLQGNGTLTIPSNLVTTQYFPTQSSKPAGYQQTLGHYVQIGGLTTTPSSLPAAAVFGPTRPGSLTPSAGSLASALGLSSTNLVAINTSGLVRLGAGTLTLNGSPILLTSGTLLNSGTYNLITSGTLTNAGSVSVPGSVTLNFNRDTSSSSVAGILTLAPSQISTVPEPSTLVLAGLAIVGGTALRLRRPQRRSATV